MNILFIADPLESFKIYKDTTFAMMREAQRRGHTVAACEPQDVMWQRGDRVMAHVREIRLTGDAQQWYAPVPAAGGRIPLRDYDRGRHAQGPALRLRVLLRDPPAGAGRAGGRPGLQPAARALRDHPEKLAIMEFAQFMRPDAGHPRARPPSSTFHAEHQRHHPEAARRHGRHAGIFRVRDGRASTSARSSRR
jgi:glutathione synthase